MLSGELNPAHEAEVEINRAFIALNTLFVERLSRTQAALIDAIDTITVLKMEIRELTPVDPGPCNKAKYEY